MTMVTFLEYERREILIYVVFITFEGHRMKCFLLIFLSDLFDDGTFSFSFLLARSSCQYQTKVLQQAPVGGCSVALRDVF